MKVNNNIIGTSSQTTATSFDNSKLSVDDFLKIMAAEIKNQNPFDGRQGGGSKTDYISQLSQLTMLEQLSSISENMGLLTLMGQQQYSFSLIGNEVSLQGEEGRVTGIVDKVKFQNGLAVLEVNGKDYGMGQLIEVTNGI